ncbi:unnamed protein product, partial [Ectocarpus fasciculatus]
KRALTAVGYCRAPPGVSTRLRHYGRSPAFILQALYNNPRAHPAVNFESCNHKRTISALFSAPTRKRHERHERQTAIQAGEHDCTVNLVSGAPQCSKLLSW